MYYRILHFLPHCRLMIIRDRYAHARPGGGACAILKGDCIEFDTAARAYNVLAKYEGGYRGAHGRLRVIKLELIDSGRVALPVCLVWSPRSEI